MKLKTIIMAVLLLSAITAYAQKPLPYKVSNVTLSSLTGEAVKLPHWGEKNLMIFYVDPDHHKQNEAFTAEMEQNHRAAGPEIFGFGIMNLKDAPMVPNGLACKMANKRTEKNHATVLADKDRILSTAWGLGDCNNKFVLMIVDKQGNLVYMKKGELTKQEQEEFYQFVDKYRN